MFGALLHHESRDFPPGRDPPVPRKGMMLDGKFAPGDSLVCHPAGGELLIPSKKSVAGVLSNVKGNRMVEMKFKDIGKIGMPSIAVNSPSRGRRVSARIRHTDTASGDGHTPAAVTTPPGAMPLLARPF